MLPHLRCISNLEFGLFHIDVSHEDTESLNRKLTQQFLLSGRSKPRTSLA